MSSFSDLLACLSIHTSSPDSNMSSQFNLVQSLNWVLGWTLLTYFYLFVFFGLVLPYNLEWSEVKGLISLSTHNCSVAFSVHLHKTHMAPPVYGCSACLQASAPGRAPVAISGWGASGSFIRSLFMTLHWELLNLAHHTGPICPGWPHHGWFPRTTHYPTTMIRWRFEEERFLPLWPEPA